MFKLLAGASIAVFASSLLAQALQQDAKAKADAVSLMSDLSQSFRVLESKLASGDTEAVVAAALELASEAPRLHGIKPEVNVSLGEEFERHATRTAELAEETRLLASQGRAAGAGQAFEELRATCVSCHLKFRSNNTVRGNYPALGNTVSGSVELRDADGQVRDNQSWVLVFLEGESSTGIPANARQNPRVSQRGRRFEPRVLPVVVGAEVEFPNDDTIFHNVFSLSKTMPFDLGAYEPGESASVRMERTGLVKVYCNIHPEMAASIVVLANPWYALTDRGGHFVICGVPDGEYVLRTWSDMGVESRESIKLVGQTVFDKHLALQESRRVVTHTNKYGRAYPGKY
jgi:plastocyanin